MHALLCKGHNKRTRLMGWIMGKRRVFLIRRHIPLLRTFFKSCYLGESSSRNTNSLNNEATIVQASPLRNRFNADACTWHWWFLKLIPEREPGLERMYVFGNVLFLRSAFCATRYQYILSSWTPGVNEMNFYAEPERRVPSSYGSTTPSNSQPLMQIKHQVRKITDSRKIPHFLQHLPTIGSGSLWGR